MDSLFGLDKVSAHDENLELLITVHDTVQQMIVESILRDAEIPFLSKSRGSGTAVKVITGFSLFATDIFVLREHLETALELITPPEDIEELCQLDGVAADELGEEEEE
ncbi:MAG: hypothetical protein J6Q82_07405 [Clostridia bacterium]|nr:hypothetical protein [Clostridia bacterium]